MSASVTVHVEYCGGWGYAPRYRELRQLILAEVPAANVTGAAGRSTSFEVTVNGKCIFSKLAVGSFPSFEQVVQECVKASKNMETSEVTEVQKSSCAIC